MIEGRQMSSLVTWFQEALGLPSNFHVKDVHTQANYQRYLKGAKVQLKGGTDISIGPSGTPCVFIEAKPTEEDFKEGQAIGELLLMDNANPLYTMVVLTDCSDRWHIFLFETLDGQLCLTKAIIDDRGIALAIIKQFVLEEGRKFYGWRDKRVSFEVSPYEPLKKKAKFIEPELDDERIADMVDGMSPEEVYNMEIRRKLLMVRNLCRLDEQVDIDRLIAQFGDDYEGSVEAIVTNHEH